MLTVGLRDLVYLSKVVIQQKCGRHEIKKIKFVQRRSRRSNFTATIVDISWCYEVGIKLFFIQCTSECSNLNSRPYGYPCMSNNSCFNPDDQP